MNSSDALSFSAASGPQEKFRIGKIFKPITRILKPFVKIIAPFVPILGPVSTAIGIVQQVKDLKRKD